MTPQLEKAFQRIHIVGGSRFSEERIFNTFNPKYVGLNEEPTAVVFTGGEDISPALYGERPIPETYASGRRDTLEVNAFKALQSQKEAPLLIGICRGAQLLNVLNGGKLFQDVDRHGGRAHALDIVDPRFKIRVPFKNVISVHHQMMRPTDDAIIIGTTKLSTRRKSYGYEETEHEFSHPDMEVLYYRATRSFCFQSHPEFGDNPTKYIFFDLLDQTLSLEETKEL